MNKLQTGWLYTLTGAVSAVSLAACMPASKPYNIVYIMTDDHTAQMMSCYDNRYIETPNLDRIANDGVRFVNSFVANSLSGPSRACMFTGKHTCGNKFYDNTTCVFDGSQQTFPKILRENGYQTAVIGKWHLESLPTGFDYWEVVPAREIILIRTYHDEQRYRCPQRLYHQLNYRHEYRLDGKQAEQGKTFLSFYSS